MKRLHFTPRPCWKCGGENGSHFGCRQSFGSSTIRFENLVIAIVARRAQ